MISLWIGKQSLPGFPWATFIANVSGCLLIGLLMGLLERYSALNGELRLLLIVGLCGGYTTFSTLSAENLKLLEAGHYITLALYVAGTLLLGLLALWIGSLLAKL
jgi:CrcB protein